VFFVAEMCGGCDSLVGARSFLQLSNGEDEGQSRIGASLGGGLGSAFRPERNRRKREEADRDESKEDQNRNGHDEGKASLVRGLGILTERAHGSITMELAVNTMYSREW
jgi:hypothetical protein